MATHFMNHRQALEQYATERYLLHEMTAEERHAFEEHYLECAECLEAVTFGTEFLEAGKQVAQEMTQREHSAVRPASWRERLMPVLSGWLRPDPALAFAVVLCSIISYQGLRIHQLKTEQTMKVARPEIRSMLTGIAHGAGEAKLIEVPRDAVVSLGEEYGRSGEYVSYRAQVMNEAGSIKQTFGLLMSTLSSTGGPSSAPALLRRVARFGYRALLGQPPECDFGRTWPGTASDGQPTLRLLHVGDCGFRRMEF